MSLKVPSFRFLLGIDTNSPLGPLMILMSVTTKDWSKTMETKALSFSSSTGMTLTSVISMMSAPSRVRPAAVLWRRQRLRQHPAIKIQGDGPPANGAEAARPKRRPGTLCPARVGKDPNKRRPAPRKGRQKRPLPDQNNPDIPPLSLQARVLLQGSPLEVVGKAGKGVALSVQLARNEAENIIGLCPRSQSPV